MKKVFIFYAITLTTCLSIQSDEIIRKPKKQQSPLSFRQPVCKVKAVPAGYEMLF